MERWSARVVFVSALLLTGCTAIGEADGTAEYTDCVKRMERLIADEVRRRESYCYTVIDKVVCDKDPLRPYEPSNDSLPK